MIIVVVGAGMGLAFGWLIMLGLGAAHIHISPMIPALGFFPSIDFGFLLAGIVLVAFIGCGYIVKELTDDD